MLIRFEELTFPLLWWILIFFHLRWSWIFKNGIFFLSLFGKCIFFLSIKLLLDEDPLQSKVPAISQSYMQLWLNQFFICFFFKLSSPSYPNNHYFSQLHVNAPNFNFRKSNSESQSNCWDNFPRKLWMLRWSSMRDVSIRVCMIVQKYQLA
jgi:hypothetical protein